MSDLGPTEADVAPTERTPPPKGVLGVVFLIVFMDLLGFGVIIPLLPVYARDFKASDFEVGLLFSIYSICQLVASPVLGMLSDRYGRRPVLIFSQLGSAIGYALLGLVTQLHFDNVRMALMFIYVSRLIDGISGGNISTAQAYIADVTSGKDRARGMGVLGAAFGLGFVAGPLLGGTLGAIGIHWPAYAAAVFSLLAMVQTIVRLPESRVHKPSEARMLLHPSTFVPILRKPILGNLLFIGFFAMGAFVIMETVVALLLLDKFGYTQKHVGYFFAYVGVIILIIQGRAIGPLTRRIGEWPLAIIGPVLIALGMLLYVAIVYRPWLWLLLVAGAFNAAGRSIFQPSLSSLTSKHANVNEQGVTFGLSHSLMSFSRVIFPMIAGWTYAHHRTLPFLISAVMSLGVGVWAMALRAEDKIRA
jgi:DHA1 family tetracycline resistance protein-like MFS transporter